MSFVTALVASGSDETITQHLRTRLSTYRKRRSLRNNSPSDVKWDTATTDPNADSNVRPLTARGDKTTCRRCTELQIRRQCYSWNSRYLRTSYCSQCESEATGRRYISYWGLPDYEPGSWRRRYTRGRKTKDIDLTPLLDVFKRIDEMDTSMGTTKTLAWNDEYTTDIESGPDSVFEGPAHEHARKAKRFNDRSSETQDSERSTTPEVSCIDTANTTVGYRSSLCTLTDSADDMSDSAENSHRVINSRSRNRRTIPEDEQRTANSYGSKEQTVLTGKWVPDRSADSSDESNISIVLRNSGIDSDNTSGKSESRYSTDLEFNEIFLNNVALTNDDKSDDNIGDISTIAERNAHYVFKPLRYHGDAGENSEIINPFVDKRTSPDITEQRHSRDECALSYSQPSSKCTSNNQDGTKCAFDVKYTNQTADGIYKTQETRKIQCPKVQNRYQARHMSEENQITIDHSIKEVNELPIDNCKYVNTIDRSVATRNTDRCQDEADNQLNVKTGRSSTKARDNTDPHEINVKTCDMQIPIANEVHNFEGHVHDSVEFVKKERNRRRRHLRYFNDVEHLQNRSIKSNEMTSGKDKKDIEEINKGVYKSTPTDSDDHPISMFCETNSDVCVDIGHNSITRDQNKLIAELSDFPNESNHPCRPHRKISKTLHPLKHTPVGFSYCCKTTEVNAIGTSSDEDEHFPVHRRCDQAESNLSNSTPSCDNLGTSANENTKSKTVVVTKHAADNLSDNESIPVNKSTNGEHCKRRRSVKRYENRRKSAIRIEKVDLKRSSDLPQSTSDSDEQIDTLTVLPTNDNIESRKSLSEWQACELDVNRPSRNEPGRRLTSTDDINSNTSCFSNEFSGQQCSTELKNNTRDDIINTHLNNDNFIRGNQHILFKSNNRCAELDNKEGNRLRQTISTGVPKRRAKQIHDDVEAVSLDSGDSDHLDLGWRSRGYQRDFFISRKSITGSEILDRYKALSERNIKDSSERNIKDSAGTRSPASSTSSSLKSVPSRLLKHNTRGNRLKMSRQYHSPCQEYDTDNESVNLEELRTVLKNFVGKSD